MHPPICIYGCFLIAAVAYLLGLGRGAVAALEVVRLASRPYLRTRDWTEVRH